MAMLSISPPKVYEVNGEVCPVIPAVIRQAGGVSNIAIVTAITGKRIRVLGWTGTSGGGTASNISLRNGSGGSYLLHEYALPAQTGGVNADKPIVDSGYGETSTGVGLYGDSNAGGAFVTFYYIAYTP